ncbi:Epoxyqueuosine reductase QueH [bioreactor metagenome]|uniref:Epoxyqueuosine reductase QueH n=1 Tax=bioreactor metagenome TaxID=1076179 RepID=A0A645A061_9ZZZZ
MEELASRHQRPRLLLHSCCAPCNCYPMLFLSAYFDLTLYFNNSNIYPETEYRIRLDELEAYTDNFNQEHQTAIKIIVTAYDNINYNKRLEPLKDLPEQSERCWLCYSLRMDEAYAYAAANGFDYFTTVMTISRQKNSVKLNEIGIRLNAKYPSVKYLISDFKKHGGSDHSAQLAKELNLYRQQYCGCLYSYQQYQMKLEQKKGK